MRKCSELNGNDEYYRRNDSLYEELTGDSGVDQCFEDLVWFSVSCRCLCVVYEKESHSLYRAGACVYVKESNNSRFQDLVWFRVLCRGGVVGRGRERQKSREIGREIGRTWFGSVPHINTHMNT